METEIPPSTTRTLVRKREKWKVQELFYEKRSFKEFK